MSTEHQITELLSFLLHPNLQLLNLAVVNLLPYTVQGSPYRKLFFETKSVGEERGYLKVLAGISRASNEEVTAKAALTALVNLTDSVTACHQIAGLDGYVNWLLQQILNTSSGLADLACMLMSNLTKLDSVCKACLEIDASKSGVKSLERLVEVFAKEGEGESKKGNYDYLGHVFANLSAVNIKDGRQSLLGMPDSLKEGSTSPVPLADLVVFTEHPNATRRVGIASTLKNCAFEQDAHPLLLSSGNVNFLPYILLPLCGPEEFDLEESDKFPEELQLLPPDKARESDSAIRLILVETLVLLSGTRAGRDVLRAKGVYEIVKVAHKVERDEEVRIAIERLVNLLMRDEPEEPKIAEVPADSTTAKTAEEEDDEDMVVQEV